MESAQDTARLFAGPIQNRAAVAVSMERELIGADSIKERRKSARAAVFVICDGLDPKDISPCWLN